MMDFDALLFPTILQYVYVRNRNTEWNITLANEQRRNLKPQQSYNFLLKALQFLLTNVSRNVIFANLKRSDITYFML